MQLLPQVGIQRRRSPSPVRGRSPSHSKIADRVARPRDAEWVLHPDRVIAMSRIEIFSVSSVWMGRWEHRAGNPRAGYARHPSRAVEDRLAVVGRRLAYTRTRPARQNETRTIARPSVWRWILSMLHLRWKDRHRREDVGVGVGATADAGAYMPEE